MKCIAMIFLALISACEPCDKKNQEESIQCLQGLPKRNLYSHPNTTHYLSKHKVYVSLTTSPARLGELSPALRTLDLEHIEKVYLSLPKLYRNQEPYPEVPEKLLQDFPKIEIIARDQDDLGPIMKMLPAVEKVGALDPDAIVISIDDDVGFPKGAVNELIYHAILHPEAVVSGAGNYAETFGILTEEWPRMGKATQEPLCGTGQLSYCDTVEGWRAIAYKPRLVNTKRMREISKLSKACRTSDDLVISYILAESGVDKIRIINPLFRDIVRFGASSDSGALHKVKLNIPGWSPRPSVDAKFSGTTNSERYQRCVLDIRSQVKQ